ncbi:MAG: glycosyltransferase [archaeon]
MKEKKSIRSRPSIGYINPPVLLKRPISDISSRLSKQGYKTNVLIPKKLFRHVDSSLHHCGLLKYSKVYTYSIINPPFIDSEQPLPVTPVFCINSWKMMKHSDIIHMWVPYYLTSLKIIFAKKLFFPKKKLILTMDTIPGYSFSMGKRWDKIFRIYNRLFGWLLFRTPDAITLYGKSLVPYALKAGVPKEKIRVLSTGVKIKPASQKANERSRQEIKDELKIKSDPVIVLFIGLVIPRKGISKIIEMADKLRKDKGKKDDIIFLIVGDGPKRGEYEQQAKRLGLYGSVRFLGWRADTQRFFQASDIVVLPAEGEGLPGVIMEAMAAGLPCVASDIPCIPDLIDDGKNGFLCKKDDVNAFAKRINELARDSNKRKKMGEEARKKISGFEWDEVIEKYKGLYNELMRR